MKVKVMLGEAGQMTSIEVENGSATRVTDAIAEAAKKLGVVLNKDYLVALDGKAALETDLVEEGSVVSTTPKETKSGS